MYMIALVFTVAGWAFQFYQTVIKKDRSINPVLPIAYTIACILFGINSYIAGDMAYGMLDAVCAALAASVFIMLAARKKAS
jgi:hypothetical protein